MNTGLPIGQQLRAFVETRLQRLWFESSPDTARSVLTALLAPLALLTKRVAGARRQRINRQRDHDRQRPDAPYPTVIIVGNLVAGGAGKTPLTIALAGFLQNNGCRVGLLCRGGPAGARAAVRLNSEQSKSLAADQIGDEAHLLAQATGLPVVIGHQRAHALAELTRHHPELNVVISDDGLQHEPLRRDLEMVVLDRRGLGNGKLLPAGPLREPAAALHDADAIIMNTGWQTDPVLPSTPPGVPVFKSALNVRDLISLDAYAGRPDEPSSIAASPLTINSMSELVAGQTVAAIAGIANPESFFELLESFGLSIRRYAPGDHAAISAEWLDGLGEPIIILTEKDAVKCDRNSRGRIHVLRISANPEPALFDWILASLPARESHQITGSSDHGPTHT